jgi:hypothetical protein
LIEIYKAAPLRLDASRNTQLLEILHDEQKMGYRLHVADLDYTPSSKALSYMWGITAATK